MSADLKKRVLIVDDEPHVVGVLLEVFARFQHGHAYDVVRQLIRRRLEDGRLPHSRMAEVRVQLGDGQLCDGCGAVTTTKQTVMSPVAQHRTSAPTGNVVDLEAIGVCDVV